MADPRRRRLDRGRPERALPIDPDLDPDDPGEPAADHRPATSTGGAPRRASAPVLAAIAAGGALGSSARYAVAQGIGTGSGHFPWATFWTNVTGAFALGVLLVVLLRRFPPSRYLRPFAATGFLGAYTTFSTFVVETDRLLDDGHAVLAATYATSSVVAGLVAVALGMAGGRLVPLRDRTA